MNRLQRALSIGIGTAVGGIIYGIFLQALLFQSLVLDRKPMDPAHWREKLTGRAWCGGLFLFLLQVGLPFRFLSRTNTGTVVSDLSESGIVWFLISVILLVQAATVLYARMRPELCMVEHPTELFPVFWMHRRPVETPIIVVQSPLVRVSVTSAPVAESKPTAQWTPVLHLSYSLRLWKNWVQLVILAIEFVQLFSMAMEGGTLSFVSAETLQTLQGAKRVFWQFGMSQGPDASFASGFGILTGFGGLYIFLCGVFIALDLTVDSWLSPFLFTLLAGGFYGMITSGLLFVILYSTSSAQILVSLLMLAYYSSTAVFVSIYRSDIKKAEPGEIRVIPTFIAVERIAKGILAGVSVVMTGATPLARSIVTVVFCAFFLALMVRVQPYSVFGITALRIVSVGVAGWTALVLCFTADSAVYTGLLLMGWVCIPMGMGLVTFCYRLQNRRVPLLATASV